MKNRNLIAVLPLVCGCADLTEVSAPDLVERPDLATPTGAVTHFNGAVSAFYGVFGTEASYSAAGSFVSLSALLSDELTATSAFSGLNELDQHVLPEANGSQGAYLFLQTARVNQLQALGVLKQVLPEESWRIGQIYGLLGYVETLLAEIMCSGVPLSRLTSDFKPEYGPPLTTAQLLEHALANFDSAATYAGDSARILHLAQVGRGRALLNLDLAAEAAAAVASVPTDFAFLTEHSATVHPNNAAMLIIQGYYGIVDNEGRNGMDYLSANDQRIDAVLAGDGLDGTPVYRPERLASEVSANIVADGLEARLIEAEAALRAGDVGGWLAQLNSLRSTATTPGMPPLADPGRAEERVDLLFRERAFWLFMSGRRFGDMRRFVRQYGRPADTVFPVGPYKFGGDFGTDIQLPIDVAEVSNNPLMGGKGCIDRNA